MRNTIKTNICKSGGFTLIEMAIVTMIVGLVIAAAAQIMTQRQQWLRAESTRLAVTSANDAITAYRNTYGEYPCPASLISVRGAADFGIQSDCSDTATVAVASGIDTTEGYARVLANAARTVDYLDRNTDPATSVTGAQPIIRIGAIPFKNLNLEESDSYDGYNNRIIYAVTEQLGDSKTFENDDGGITVIDEQNNMLTEQNHAAHFIIFSTGENGAGGFTSGGNRIACTNTSLESDNCNFDVDAQFRFAQTSTEDHGSASTFDDIVTYATHEGAPLWEKDPADVGTGNPGENDVGMMATGNLGIGFSAAKNPTEEFQIDGVLVARDDPTTTAPGEVEGKIESESICDYASGTTTCFPSSLIAGDLTAGDGMSCPAGEFMVGIRNGAPLCVNEVRVECPTGQFAVGIQSDGSLDCGEPPPPGCETTNANLCTHTETLFAADHGDTQTISVSTSPGNPGGTRYAAYRCDNGSWVNDGTWGDPCDCTPTTSSARTVSCAEGSWPCGTRFTGTREVEDQFICPSGTWDTNNVLSESCVCEPTFRDRNRNCPDGFNSGEIIERNTHDCSTQTCSGWIEDTNTCACTPETDTRQVQCSSGLTGMIDQERHFTCPSGSTSPGVWSDWENVGGQPDDHFCSCVASSTLDTGRECPTAGHIGDYWVRVDFECPSAQTVETVERDTCAPPPPIVCQWTMTGTGGPTSDTPLSTKDGNLCDCGVEQGATESCSKSLGGGSYRYGSCICQ